MLRVVASPVFVRLCKKFWSNQEREDFETWISEHYEAGVVVPRTRGLRKVRYATAGRGKSGGARVIYYLATNEGEVWLLAAHTKSSTERFSDAFMNELRKLVPYD